MQSVAIMDMIHWSMVIHSITNGWKRFFCISANGVSRFCQNLIVRMCVEYLVQLQVLKIIHIFPQKVFVDWFDLMV